MWEKAYGGVLWAQPEEKRSARLSVGRQNWQLNNGFLFSRYAAGANAGPNPAMYLNPRTTYQMAVLAEVRNGPLELEYFDLDPAELKAFDSNTRFQGLRAGWQEDQAWDLGLAAYRVPESNTMLPNGDGSFTPRKGQRTLDLRVGHRDLGGGFSALAEAAWQDSTEAAISARAWYAQLAYTAQALPWKPSLLYRYASFSGDRPGTSTREAFDAPLSSGLDEWVQGVNFKKVVTNSNLNSHRVRLNAGPDPRLNFTLDFYHLWADVPLPDRPENLWQRDRSGRALGDLEAAVLAGRGRHGLARRCDQDPDPGGGKALVDGAGLVVLGLLASPRPEQLRPTASGRNSQENWLLPSVRRSSLLSINESKKPTARRASFRVGAPSALFFATSVRMS